MLTEFKSIFDLVEYFPNDKSCIEYLEKHRWNGSPVSPFDANSKVYKCAHNKYKCKNTGKYFNVKVGTIFENTNIKLKKWFMALFIFSSHKKGISSHQLGRDISVTQKSAWFMLHRLRYAFDHSNFKELLSNQVEIDETYMGGNEKNKSNSKKTEGTQGRSTQTKNPVLGMKERDGNVIAKVVDDTKANTILPIIKSFVNKDSQVYTDEYKAYNSLSKSYSHLKVNHSAKAFVNAMAHTNGLENFWSHLKRGVDGIYHWVSKAHLQSYVDEFVLRYNTRKLSTFDRFNVVLCNATARLTYGQLIRKSK